MVERPRKLVRQIKRKFGTPDADAGFLDLHRQLTDGENVAPDHPAIAGLAGLSDFIYEVAETYEHYDDTVKLHIRNANISSEELNQANGALAQLNNSLSTIMESLGEGLLFFGADGICSDVYSRASKDIFGRSPADIAIWELLQLDAGDASEMQTLLNIVFNADTAMSFEDMMALAPDRYSQGDKDILLSYRPVTDSDGQLKAIVMVAMDRTRESQAIKQAIQKEKEASRIIRISRNRNAFIRLIINLRALFDDLDGALTGEAALPQFKRDIHTFKGLAGSFYLTHLADCLHNLETRLAGQNRDRTLEICRTEREPVFRHLDQASKTAAELFGAAFEQRGTTRTIPASQLAAFGTSLHELVAGGATADQVQRLFLEQLASVSIRESLSGFTLQLQELSDRVGKRLYPLRFEGQDCRIVMDIYGDVIQSLVHAGRNIVDHGIEDPNLRQQLGKDPAGQVTVTTALEDRNGAEWLLLIITDDGGGIDTEKLRKRLVEKGIIDADAGLSDQELIRYVFHDEVSTARTSSQTSGRGIGMSAIKAAVEALDGTVDMVSAPGKGCTLTLAMPYIWQHDSRLVPA